MWVPPRTFTRGMTPRGGSLGAALVALLFAIPSPEDPAPRKAPPFPTSDPAAWIGHPASWQELSGRVVLLDVWTFG